MNDKKIIFFLFSLISFILLAGTFFAYASINEGTFTISQCTTSGSILKAESRYMGVGTSSGAQPKHYACDTNDILVCTGYQTGIILSACNVGASVAGTGKVSNGMYFQYGRNKGFYYSNGLKYDNKLLSNNVGLNSSKDSYGFIVDDASWSMNIHNDNWGKIGSSELERQGPCADGYHIPNRVEMTSIFESNQKVSEFFSDTGKIQPINGGLIFKKDNLGVYWIINDVPLLGGYIDYDNGNSFGITNTTFSQGLPIRCFKNLGEEKKSYTTEKIKVPFSEFQQAFQEYFEVDSNNYFKKFGKTFELVPVIEQPILLEDNIWMFQDYKERLKNDVIYKKGGKYFYSNGGYYFVRIK